MPKTIRQPRQCESVNLYDNLLCIDMADQLYELQQEMMDKGYYVDFFDVDDYWSDYSNAYCAVFLGRFGEFNEEQIQIAKEGGYSGNGEAAFEVEEISEEEAELIEKSANKLFSLYREYKENESEKALEIYIKYAENIYLRRYKEE